MYQLTILPTLVGGNKEAWSVNGRREEIRVTRPQLWLRRREWFEGKKRRKEELALSSWTGKWDGSLRVEATPTNKLIIILKTVNSILLISAFFVALGAICTCTCILILAIFYLIKFD